MEVPYLASAVEMNNMAISLAERYHYAEALKTFKLAVQVLQGNMTVSEVEHKLYRAQLYLQTESDGELSFEQEQRSTNDCRVKICNFQGQDLLFRPTNTTDDEDAEYTRSLIYLYESDLPKYGKSVEVYSTILSCILQNQAQMCRKLARNEKDGTISATFQRKSHQLSTLAEAFSEKHASQQRLGKITKSFTDIPRKKTPPRYPLRRVESAASLRLKHT